MPEAPTQAHASAVYFYGTISQSLQSLLLEHRPLGKNNARQLADKLRLIADQLEAGTGCSATPETTHIDARQHGAAELASLESSWATPSFEQAGSGMIHLIQ